MPRPALAYTPDVEQPEAGEAEIQQELIEAFRSIIDTTHEDYGHAFRSVHAKSHALLEGEMEVLPNLPPELAQGIFAAVRTYPVVLRISTNAGDPLPDSISLPRGLAIKVIGVEGERLPGSEGDATQDFVLANGPAFQAGSLKMFAANLKMLAKTTDKAEWGKKAISALFRWTEKGVEAVGGESVMLKSLGGYPQTHPLGETYYSQAAIRYGDHVAKLGVFPRSANFKALEDVEIDVAGREDALREELVGALAEQGGEWEVRIQLRRDADANPVEDPSKPWPEDDNPYLPVAVIRIAPQTAWSFDRADVIDDQTAFSPWHGIEAHRPLGAIMRARKPAYEDSSNRRARLNGCPIHEPRELPELPA